MIPRRANFLPLAALLLLAAAAPAAAQTNFTTNAPIINFRLPTFTPQGNREWLVRGSEARILSQDLIDIRELTLTIFKGDATEHVDTMILSPAARVQPSTAVATGDATLRVLNDDFEVTGRAWRYDHREKRVSIAKDVHVVFKAELKDYLK